MADGVSVIQFKCLKIPFSKEVDCVIVVVGCAVMTTIGTIQFRICEERLSDRKAFLD